MTKRMWDAVSPNAGPASWEVAAGYIPGGDAYHGWTDAEWHVERARYRLPIFVRSNPNGASEGQTEGSQAVAWAKRHGQPRGTSIVLDLETAIDTAYVNAFNTTLFNSGYLCIAYGSGSTLFHNPKCHGGYWLANPGTSPHIDTRSVATQYAFYGSYDASLILDSVPLWDTHVAPTPGKVIDMASGQLKNGLNAEDVVTFPAGSGHGVQLGADNGAQGKPAAIVRVAVWDKNRWHVTGTEKVVVDSTKGPTQVPFADPSTTTLVSFFRQDAGDVNVGWSLY